MFKRIAMLSLCLALLIITGCATKISAPKMTSGDPISLYLVCDKGITSDMTNKQIEQINEVSAFMKNHFLGYASKSGYKPIILEEKAAFRPMPGSYLLAVTIKKYNPGNKALRMTIGFGAGAVSMDIHYDLYADASSSILSRDDGVGSSNPNWIVVPAKLNEKMLIEVTKEITRRS